MAQHGAKLRDIAYVSIVYSVPSKEKHWRDQLLLVAEYLGELAEAEHWLQRYDRKVKFAWERLKCAVKDDSFLIVRVFRQNLYVYCNRSIKWPTAEGTFCTS